MPRPKRTKVTLNQPAKSKPAISAQQPQKADQQQQPPRKLAVSTRGSCSRPEKSSSDSDDLVRSKPLNSPHHSQHGQTNSPQMSGGLGQGDARGMHKELQRITGTVGRARTRNSHSGRPLRENADVGNHSGRRGNAQPKKTPERLESGGSEGRSGKTDAGSRLLATARSPSPDGEQALSCAQDENGPPAPGSAIGNRETDVVERITDSQPSSQTRIPKNNNASNAIPPVSSAPASASKLPNTPSFLSMANFQKRPRQGSLLGMVRRRQSLINDSANASELERTSGDVDEGDTSLLTLGVTPSTASEPAVRSSSSHKRKAAELNRGKNKVRRSDDSENERGGKRLSTGTLGVPQRGKWPSQHDRSRISDAPNDSAAVDTPTRNNGDGIDMDSTTSSSNTSLERHLARLGRSNNTPTTTRPKQSQTRTRHHRTSSPINATSPLSTSSSSPQPTKPTTAAPKSSTRTRNPPHRNTKQKPKPPTTASLKCLLPSRRRTGLRTRQPRAQDEFDVLGSPSSDEQTGLWANGDSASNSEGDELARPSRKGRFVDKPSRPVSKSKGKTATKRKALNPHSNNARVSASTKGKGKSAGGRDRPARTYTRRASGHSEQENEDADPHADAEDDFAGEPSGGHAGGGGKTGRPGTKEMEDAAAKFAEVDEWELSFESADIGAGGSSSPWR